MKTFVIGDIHGCLNTLKSLLELIKINFNEDKLIFLGDYIDRGKWSIDTVLHIKKLVETYPNNVIALKGNHEDMCIRYMKYIDKIWSYNGFEKSINDLRELDEDVKNELLHWIENLPERYNDGYFKYCHSGYWENDLDGYGLKCTLWDRNWLRYNTNIKVQPTIFGHTPLKDVTEVYPEMYDIDTGCVYGNKLTCVIVENSKIVDTISVEQDEKDCLKSFL